MGFRGIRYFFRDLGLGFPFLGGGFLFRAPSGAVFIECLSRSNPERLLGLLDTGNVGASIIRIRIEFWGKLCCS